MAFCYSNWNGLRHNPSQGSQHELRVCRKDKCGTVWLCGRGKSPNGGNEADLAPVLLELTPWAKEMSGSQTVMNAMTAKTEEDGASAWDVEEGQGALRGDNSEET